MTELKPCPFCDKLMMQTENNYGYNYIRCLNCKCNIGPYESLKEAFEQWNTRATSKDRELLLALSLPQLSREELVEISRHMSYQVNKSYTIREADIALRIRKYLEENP